MKVMSLVLGIFLFDIAGVAYSADKLVIISPHRKSIQDEFLPVFKEHYKATFKNDVDVEWIDQGGTSDDVRFLRAKFAANPKTAGIDLFWGGGTSTFTDLTRERFLDAHTLPSDVEVPKEVAGVALRDRQDYWFGSAMSSFGIFTNKKIMALEKLPQATSWSDLTKPEFVGQIVLADPRRAGSASTMSTIILQSLGWENGWRQLILIGANTRTFTHSSSDPIKAIIAGDSAISLAIDFYATPKVAELGEQNLGFMLPPGQIVLDPDPIGLIKGAPNRKVAERFINWVLSTQAQKLLILPKGQKDGPKLETLGRMSVLPKAYQETEGRRIQPFNPFNETSSFKLDLEKSAKTQRIFNDLIGAIQVDTHSQLIQAWKAIIKRGSKAEEIKELTTLPLTEAEYEVLASKWSDDILRNKTINQWVEFAKAKYSKLAKNP